MIQRIDHVNIVVRNMPAMIAFYRDILGLRVTREATIRGSWIGAVTGLEDVEADVVFLEMPEGPTIELLCYRTPAGDRPQTLGLSNTQGLRHIAFRVTEIDAMVEAMKAAGVAFLGEVQKVPATQVDYADVQKQLVYFRDPEDNLLELCCYTPRSSKQ
jgi:catechol 2,3-dioxygenase-like lactoylglutathione lyase family enzyme